LGLVVEGFELVVARRGGQLERLKNGALFAGQASRSALLGQLWAPHPSMVRMVLRVRVCRSLVSCRRRRLLSIQGW
jgi:hypothetical protein